MTSTLKCWLKENEQVWCYQNHWGLYFWIWNCVIILFTWFKCWSLQWALIINVTFNVNPGLMLSPPPDIFCVLFLVFKFTVILVKVYLDIFVCFQEMKSILSQKMCLLVFFFNNSLLKVKIYYPLLYLSKKIFCLNSPFILYFHQTNQISSWNESVVAILTKVLSFVVAYLHEV